MKAYSHDLGLRSLIRGAEAYATRHASEPGERLEELVHSPSQCQKGIVNYLFIIVDAMRQLQVLL